MKGQVKDYWIILFAAVLFLLCMQGCKIVPPVETSDSTSYRMTVRDSAFTKPPDSSEAKYMLECVKTNEGLKVRIMQLLSQRPGERIYIPVSTIDSNNVLTTTAYLPGETIYVPVYRFFSTSIKAKTFVKVTNVLTGWQWFQLWLGRVFAALLLIYVGFKILKRYTSIKLP